MFSRATPDAAQVVDDIAALAALGVTWVTVALPADTRRDLLTAVETFGTQVITLGAFMHTQTALAGENGLFTSETSDFAGRSATFLASAPLFAYASIVDNDSGDASFVLPSVLE